MKYSRFRPDLPDAERPPAAPVPIRPARPDDSVGIARVRAERHGDDSPRHLRWARQMLRRASHDHLLLIAEAEGQVVGYGAVGAFEPPAQAPSNTAPAGYYLRGVVVAEAWQRHGIGHALTEHRLHWVSERAERAYYCVSAENLASLRLHERFGFVELTRDVWFPRMDFGPAGGVLLVCELTARFGS